MYDAIASVFEKVINNFYKKGVSVKCVDTAETAYCEGNNITLPKDLLERFTQDKLPRFTVLYHELGHALYSHDLTALLRKWQNMPVQNNPYAWDEKYMHLINWIEDLFIEWKLVQDYSYLYDIINCLKKLTFTYDIEAIDKAFNHYYIRGCAPNVLGINDGLTFHKHIDDLLTLRKAYMFGQGPITLLSNKSKETKYIKGIIDFFNWCVSKTIFEDVPLPPLSNPNNILQKGNGSGQSNQNTSTNRGKGSSISQHTHMVGQYKEVFPDIDASNTVSFVKEFVAENKLIKEELANRSKVDCQETSLDGLFNSTYSDSAVITNKAIIKNFYNPNRLIDHVLFKYPNKSFNNVSIYRDISGSTHNNTSFSLINSICKFLIDKIPIAKHFYLYASGDISILETDFQDWDDSDNIPDVYSVDETFQQFSWGTNSGAIADVMTEQLSDKWLNIIVTDGDLNDLMRRDNINSLLENVYVIAIDDDCNRSVIDPSRYIFIKDESEIESIIGHLVNMKGGF